MPPWVEKALAHPNIERRIHRIINRPSNTPRDMILFAEWLEKKHKRGFVVYWCTAGQPRFEVCNWEEWEDAQTRPWNGPAHWHTSLCSVNV